MFYLYAIIILLILAIAPPALLMLVIYRLDRLEREPPKLMWKIFGYGLLTTIPILALEYFAQGLIYMYTWGEITGQILRYFFMAGFIEEGIKYVMLYIVTWDEPNFNYKFDGVVYAVFISLGFALVENVRYVMESGLWTAVMRAVLAIPGHCIFGIIMGSRYGEAKALEEESDARSRRMRRSAWLQAAVAHGIYDFLLVRNNYMLFAGYFIIMVAIGVKRLRESRRDDGPVRKSEGSF